MGFYGNQQVAYDPTSPDIKTCIVAWLLALVQGHIPGVASMLLSSHQIYQGKNLVRFTLLLIQLLNLT